MTFLNPLILFGLIAASIPVVLHFLNLRKLQKIEFSTLAFLKELQKSKIKRIKLKQWLLLILRILIIACIVISFARPTVENLPLGSSSAKTTAVIIIDNTFSMSVVAGNGSYFNKAKQSAKALLNIFKEEDEVVIIPVGTLGVHDINTKSNLDYVRKEIDELQISYLSKTLNEAVVKAGQILYQSKNHNKEIYILTDLQSGRLINSQNEIPNLKSLLGNSRVFLIDLHEKNAVNLSVDKFELKNQIFEKNKKIGFTAEVKNNSDIPVNNSVASLFINGKRSAQQSISLQPNETSSLSFESTLTEGGFIEVAVELEDDDINYDNKRYTCFYVPENIKVLLLTEFNEDSKFVKLALSNPGVNEPQITEENSSQSSSLNLTKYDAVFLIGSVPTNAAQNILNYIENGKGLVLMPGNGSSIQSIKNTFKNLNLPEPSGFIGKQNSPESAVSFYKVDFQNPLFENLFEENDRTRIESPDIYFYTRINPGAEGKTIISMYDNSAFLSEYKVGSGKILVYNTAPTLSSSSFPFKSIFAPLMNKSLFYVSSQKNEAENIFPGNDVFVNIQNVTVNQIKIEKPNHGISYLNTDSLSNKKYLLYQDTDVAGIYKFYANNNLLDFFVVNNDPKESVAKYETVDDFENYLNKASFEGSFISLSADDDFQKTIYASRFGIELWQYFLIAALLLALLEMFVAKSAKKDLVEQ